MKRTKADIEQRADAIRAATPDVLPRLFEMQNQICDLCEHPMQDLIVATLEHSVPVIVFARGPLPIAKAERQCNAPGNLRAAHGACNSVKNGLTRKEWFARGLNETVGKPRLLTDGQLLELQFRLGENGRKGGRISGRIQVEKGLGCHAPGMAEKGGRISGRIAAQNGTGCHAPGMAEKGGRIVGRINKEKKIGIFAPGMQAKGGRITAQNGTGCHAPGMAEKGGRISGRIAAQNGTGCHAPGMAEKGGRIVGRINKEKKIGIFAPGMQAKGGRITAQNGTGCHAPGMAEKGGRISGRIAGRIVADQSLKRRIAAAPNAKVARAQRIKDRAKRKAELLRLGFCSAEDGACQEGPGGTIAPRWGHRTLCRACTMYMRESNRRCRTAKGAAEGVS
jgi:hypothetical protein